MIQFDSDYTEGCIPEILDAIAQENYTQLQGYSEDPISQRAKERIKQLCQAPDAQVHFW